MPRKQREKSGTGIYHVMMRGINHQDIFEDRGDYWKFLKLLRMQTYPEDNTSKPLPVPASDMQEIDISPTLIGISAVV